MQVDDAANATALRQMYPRAAVVHEWLTVPGGSEKVVMRILQLLPHAELFTAIYDPEPWPDVLTERPVHASFLNRFPDARRRYQRLVPLMDAAFRSFDLDGFDLVVSSNHACAKNVRTPSAAVHVCYCHTPMRYAWDASFLDHERIRPAVRALAPIATACLRRIDRTRAMAPDVMVASSTFVRGRICDSYGRDSVVVHPPVEIERLLRTPRAPTDAYLVFGRVVPYKRVDVAIAACRRLGRRLIVAGGGRDLPRARTLAGPGVELLGPVPDEQLPGLFSAAHALLSPGIEDFGIVPVEAQAAGVPVIASAAGGVRDSVVDEETGLLYEPGTVEGLCAAIRRFEALSFDERTIRANALRFAPERFDAEFAAVLESARRG